MACPVCGDGFLPGGRRRYCTDACRAAAFRRRRASAAPPVVLPAGSRGTTTVYGCDDCGGRAVGGQRCEDCSRFMRRLGPGGACPGCDEPVTVAELLGGGPAD